MSRILSISVVGVSIPSGEKKGPKFQLWKNKQAKRRRSGGCQCQQSSSLHEILGKEGNGATDAVTDGLSFKNVIAVTELAERKAARAGGAGEGALEEKYLEKEARDLLRAGTGSYEEGSSLEKEAWELLRDAVVNYCGSPIGTIAANNPSDPSSLNYDQVFIRDFIPSGIAFLLKGEYDIVRNFILHTLQLQVNKDVSFTINGFIPLPLLRNLE